MSDRTVSLRKATRMDLDDMYRWRCDEDIYRWFRNQDEPLDWDNHISWWESRSDGRDDFIIEQFGGGVGDGVVAIAEDGDVGIYIGEKRLWGEGLAKEALKKAIDRVDRDLVAQIHQENTRSQHLFESVGFERTGADGEWIEYELA